MILVDYTCGTCGSRMEHQVPSPPPPYRDCPVCRSRAKRCYSPVALSGRARPPSAPEGREPTPSCRDYPDVPGLCHLTPEAARAWTARARGDHRALDREIERQEQAFTGQGAPEPIQHGHRHP